MKINKMAIIRFLKYCTIGVSTFLFDLLLLFIFVSVFKINYIIASGIAFFIAVSINYFISRRIVFSKTRTLFVEGYIKFVVIAVVGVALIMTGMYVFVSILGIYYLFARCFISSFVGVGNYLFNLYFNFKVAGKY